MKPGVSRRFVLGSLALVAGQSVLFSRVSATDDPPNSLVHTYVRATAVDTQRPPFPSHEMCDEGAGEEGAYAELLKQLDQFNAVEGRRFRIAADSIEFSTENPCPQVNATAPRECSNVQHRSKLCKEVSVECTKFQMVGSGRGLTRAGARRRALRQLEAGLSDINKTICDCESLEWIEY